MKTVTELSLSFTKPVCDFYDIFFFVFLVMKTQPQRPIYQPFKVWHSAPQIPQPLLCHTLSPGMVQKHWPRRPREEEEQPKCQPSRFSAVIGQCF